MASNVLVCCRFRPARSEIEANDTNCVEIDGSGKTVQIRVPVSRAATNDASNDMRFNFDRVLSWDSTQEEVYQLSSALLVTDVLAGVNCTSFVC